MWVRAFAIWLVLVLIAIANGAIREGILVPRLGTAVAHVVSTVLLCLAIVAVAIAGARWIGARSVGDALLVGAFWLVLVLAFEFGFGHYVAHKSWPELLADYD